MSRLLGLYPRAWRARYGPEIAAILGAEPPTLGDRFDLIRGAIDAHLHPELVDRDADPRDVRDQAAGSVLSGILIALGSALWLAGVATVALQPLGFGYRESSALGPLVSFAGVLYAVGLLRLLGSAGIPGRIGPGIIAALALAVLPMTWPISVVGFWGLMLALAITAINRAMAGRWPSWLAWTIAVAAFLGLGTNTESGAMWLATLPALAMAMLALLSGLRRLPTGPKPVLAAEGARS